MATDAATAVSGPRERSSRLLRLLPGFFMILFLGAGALMAFSMRETYRWPEGSSPFDGELTAAFEESFNEALPLRQTAIDTWGALEYLLFSEGRDGVLVGSDGWLFSSEEFTFYPNEAEVVGARIDYIARVQEGLAEEGIALVVALVPAKARVYEEQLGRYRLPGYARERYRVYREALLERGVVAPDLLTPLLAAKAADEVFLRTDTHWTPYGAEIAAQALAQAVRPLELPGLLTEDFVTEELESVTHEGDLLKFIPLGPLRSLGPQVEAIGLRETRGRSGRGEQGLFSEVKIPVALVGTSYSANALWNFDGALKAVLGADVLNVATEGEGPIIPMIDYLESEAFESSRPELVVWELPVRYFPVEYDVEYDVESDVEINVETGLKR